MYHYHKGTCPYTKMQHSATDTRKNHDKRNAPMHHSKHTIHQDIIQITSHSPLISHPSYPAHEHPRHNIPFQLHHSSLQHRVGIESIVLAMGRSPGANDQASQPRE